MELEACNLILAHKTWRIKVKEIKDLTLVIMKVAVRKKIKTPNRGSFRGPKNQRLRVGGMRIRNLRVVMVDNSEVDILVPPVPAVASTPHGMGGAMRKQRQFNED